MTQEQEKSIERIKSRGCSVRGVIELSEVALGIEQYSSLHSASYSGYPTEGTIQVGFESPTTGRDREALIAPDGKRIRTWNTWNY